MAKKDHTIDETENAEAEVDSLLQEEQSQANPQDEFKEKYVRLLAEFTNAMKQKDIELKAMSQYGNKNLLLKVLDILDDIEMGLQQEDIQEETDSILKMLQSKIAHMVSLEGVTEIGIKELDDYDSNTCEVLSAIPDDEKKGKIVAVVRKGYMFGERVLRSAKVVVGK